VTERQRDEIREIEATQAALRASIEQTKGLAEKAESLLQQHKQTLQSDQAA
jgi:ABC-type transporter Mla subunit MlaD